MARNWLVEYRKNAGLTHQEVADTSKIKRAYYTQLELGVRNPSPRVAKLIAKKLKFDWTLFFESECSITRQNIAIDETCCALEPKLAM